MQGIPYKDTFAAKGSQLYEALVAKDAVKIKQTYALTTASYIALLDGMAVPRLVVQTEGKGKGLWSIVSDDATWDNNGRIVSR